MACCPCLNEHFELIGFQELSAFDALFLVFRGLETKSLFEIINLQLRKLLIHS